ncbi:hypothetical protein N7468_006979 [Penicillium chermesinum]|uniref:C2H2-type domain-containing protein n=1 Tax=Penicillium chermesinum TaxID=63820 RepID=A0A9W9TKB8_9EURO|nr:uncharacterized protein N7468_006979 [Penicillium chermesinum]KAJ5225754.1 hypothetical protein N7468_006979 [Penicillium chermesinum]
MDRYVGDPHHQRRRARDPATTYREAMERGVLQPFPSSPSEWHLDAEQANARVYLQSPVPFAQVPWSALWSADQYAAFDLPFPMMPADDPLEGYQYHQWMRPSNDRFGVMARWPTEGIEGAVGGAHAQNNAQAVPPIASPSATSSAATVAVLEILTQIQGGPTLDRSRRSHRRPDVHLEVAFSRTRLPGRAGAVTCYWKGCETQSTFGRMFCLKRHVEKHLNLQLYKCSSCSRTFHRKDKIKEHVNGSARGRHTGNRT